MNEDCDGWTDEYAVPSAWPTVEAALADAPDGAVIQFDEGLHLVRVDLRGRDVTLAGAGCERTVLYGQQVGSVVSMDAGLLTGMTLTGGAGTAPNAGEPTLGGGLWVDGGDVTVRNVCFDMNSVSGNGGAIATAEGSTLHVEDSRFTDNQALEEGGAIAADRSTVDVLRSTFVGNIAYEGRSGALVGRGSDVVLQNVAFAHNRTDNSFGGATVAVYPWASAPLEPDATTRRAGSLTLDQVTVTGSGGTRSAVHIEGGPLTVTRSIFTQNAETSWVLEASASVPDDLGGVLLGTSEVSEVGFAHNHAPDLRGTRALTHALREDPDHVSVHPDQVDLRLRTGSPFADLGPGLDLDGSLADWGAYGGPLAASDALAPLQDADTDGLIDGWELRHGLPTFFDDASGDLDGDGLTHALEHALDADPRVPDTDDDGVDDLTESTLGTDPTDPRDQIPVADAGGRQLGLIGRPVSLDGSQSFDPNDDALTFAWTLTAPGGSLITEVDDPTAAIATFTPDATGTWTLTLTVSDGLRSSTHATVLTTTPGVHVPTDFATLEEALSEVASGEGIAVDPGVHPLSASVSHKDVTVFGTGPGVVLQGDGESPVLSFDDGTLALADLTLQGGWTFGAGGCLAAFAGELVQLTRVTAQDCGAGVIGGGIYALDIALDAEDLVLRRNHAPSGGGLGLIDVDVVIDGCEMSENTASLDGAAVEHRKNQGTSLEDAQVNACTFSGNVGPSVVHLDGPSLGMDLTGSLAWRNVAAHTVWIEGRTAQASGLTAHGLVFADELTDAAVVGESFGATLIAVQQAPGSPPLVGNGDVDAATRRTVADVRPAFSVVGQDPALDMMFGRLGSSMHDQGWIDHRDPDGSRADAGRAGRRPSDSRWRLDVDGDGMSDGWEVWAGLDPTVDDGTSDADGDGVSAFGEHAAGTHPGLADSDADGESDGEELTLALDPLDPNDNRPVAEAGAPQALALGDTVSLDGSGSSDPNGDPLTWAWTLIAAPLDSSLTSGSLDDPGSMSPAFVPDVRGTYRLALVVSDGASMSLADEVVITVSGEIAVPGDAPSVEAAVAMVVPGDVVRVAAGVWPTRLEHAGAPFSLVGVSAEDTVLVGVPGSRVVHVTGGTQVTLRDLTLERGAAEEGGGLRCSQAAVALERVVIRENVAVKGGGLFADSCDVDLVDTDLVRNEATGNGGGVHMTGSGAIRALRGAIRDNTGARGGGVYTSAFSTATLENVVIAFNVATDEGGGLYRSSSGSIVARHVTVIGNEAKTVGGLYAFPGPLAVLDSVFASNTGTQITVVGSLADVSVSTTALWRPEAPFQSTNPFSLASLAQGNLLANPGLAGFDPTDPSALDVRLRPLSVLVDKGSDQDPDGSRSDLGATGGPLAGADWAYWFTDLDVDGMSDRWEELVGLDPTVDDSQSDPDGDGLSSLQEYPLALRPDLADTDGDGVDDGTEQTGPTDPRNPTDHRPRAVPGEALTVDPGVPVSLDGSGSTDPNGDPLTFAWTLGSAPGRSARTSADLLGADTAIVGFTPDVPGAYGLDLVVHDGTVASLPARVTVSVTGDLDVPLDYATVAQAMAAASSGATITVGPGTWVESLEPAGKPLVLQGSGAGVTLLRGPGFGRVVTMHTDRLDLRDLTVAGGLAPQGGGVLVTDAEPDLVGVHLTGNTAVYGGGLFVAESVVDLAQVRLADNRAASGGAGVSVGLEAWLNGSQVLFAGNHSSGFGGGAAIDRGTLYLTNAVFADNHAATQGGAVYTVGTDSVTALLELGQITGAYNRAASGGFLYGTYTDASVWNAIFVGSDAYTIAGNGGTAAMTYAQRYTLVWDSAPGIYMIAETPSLMDGNQFNNPSLLASDDGDWTNDAWTIALSSPAQDAGDPTSPPDLDGSIAQPGAFGGPDGLWLP